MDLWINALVGLLSGLGGALLGAYVSYVLGRRHAIQRARIERTLRLMEQYNSPEMLRIRGDADRILSSYFETHATCSWNELYRNLKESYTPISVVYHFFQQVLCFHECGELDDIVAQKYWSRHYTHWYNKHFDKLSDASILRGEETEDSTTKRLFRWLGTEQASE